ncbi:hypothetical protein NQ318_004114 [Aromia moschata]|uniref:Uncharacterized protein n=1 Tax=Aromia moschata TaxID=1265417 RepID=A0AAV8XIM0_9CUCU|nr:hypothetical protein NQ318_004114 [Aromia moschata]
MVTFRCRTAEGVLLTSVDLTTLLSGPVLRRVLSCEFTRGGQLVNYLLGILLKKNKNYIHKIPVIAMETMRLIKINEDENREGKVALIYLLLSELGHPARLFTKIKNVPSDIKTLLTSTPLKLKHVGLPVGIPVLLSRSTSRWGSRDSIGCSIGAYRLIRCLTYIIGVHVRLRDNTTCWVVVEVRVILDSTCRRLNRGAILGIMSDSFGGGLNSFAVSFGSSSTFTHFFLSWSHTIYNGDNLYTI